MFFGSMANALYKHFCMTNYEPRMLASLPPGAPWLWASFTALASRSRSSCMGTDCSQWSGSCGKVPSLSSPYGRDSNTTSGSAGPYIRVESLNYKSQQLQAKQTNPYQSIIYDHRWWEVVLGAGIVVKWSDMTWPLTLIIFTYTLAIWDSPTPIL